MFFLTLKFNWVQLSRIFPTLRKSKFSFPSFFQHKKWQSLTFCIYSDHKILQSLSFRAFSAIKNYKVQLSKLFPPSKMTKSNFPSFLRLKKWQCPNFQAVSEILHSEFRTLFGISCYGSLKEAGPTCSVLSLTFNKCDHLKETKSIIVPVINSRTFNDIFDEHHDFGLKNNQFERRETYCFNLIFTSTSASSASAYSQRSLSGP